MTMATDSDRRDFHRQIFFSFAGIAAGLAVAGLIALLINNVIEPIQDNRLGVAEVNHGITFYLREDAKWPDGTPITADDVVSCYNARPLSNAGAGTTAEQLFPEDAILVCEKITDYIVKFSIRAVPQEEQRSLLVDVLLKQRMAEYIRRVDSGILEEAFEESPTGIDWR